MNAWSMNMSEASKGIWHIWHYKRNSSNHLTALSSSLLTKKPTPIVFYGPRLNESEIFCHTASPEKLVLAYTLLLYTSLSLMAWAYHSCTWPLLKNLIRMLLSVRKNMGHVIRSLIYLVNKFMIPGRNICFAAPQISAPAEDLIIDLDWCMFSNLTNKTEKPSQQTYYQFCFRSMARLHTDLRL